MHKRTVNVDELEMSITSLTLDSAHRWANYLTTPADDTSGAHELREAAIAAGIAIGLAMATGMDQDTARDSVMADVVRSTGDELAGRRREEGGRS